MAQELHIEFDESAGEVKITGPLDLYHLSNAKKLIAESIKHAGKKTKQVIIDTSGITHLDTAGAMVLHNAVAGDKAQFKNLTDEQKSILSLMGKDPIKLPPVKKPRSPFYRAVEHLGAATVKAYDDTIEIITFSGHALVALFAALSKPNKLRFGSITHHIQQIGMNGIPIVSLIAFLISIVLAYQGEAQLKPLGAEQFTVNLIAISVLREMGVMLTAIMVAGRSGSAFTAEIGVMKVREEVDALKTIGIDPFEILVVPRLIAILICLPLLTFIADMMGLFGGAILSLSIIGISLPEYLDRVHHAVKFSTFYVGFIKAPIFAFTIAIVGCLHGLKVSGSSESVGRETTASVVKSIFLVLLLDAIFSIVFQKLGI